MENPIAEIASESQYLTYTHFSETHAFGLFFGLRSIIGSQRLEFFNLSISVLKYPTDLVGMYIVGCQLKKSFHVFTNANI